jgi:hypothetical protein
LHAVRDDSHAQLEALQQRLQETLAKPRAATPDEPGIPHTTP